MSPRKLFAAKSLFALVMAIAGARFLHDLDHNAVISAAGALSTISGVLFGFVLASVTMLSSFDSSKGIVGALKSNGVLKGIIEGLFETGTTLIAACLSAMISMFAPAVSNLALGKVRTSS